MLASLGQPDDTKIVGNLDVKFAERSEVYLVNPGARTDEGFAGFDFTEVIDTRATRLYNFRDKPMLKLSGQAVLSSEVQDDPTRWHPVPDLEPVHLWLSAQKITNSLQIGPRELNPQLRIHELDGGLPNPASRNPSKTSVRAAAISATELIVQRAALELDVAPEEFDALAPYSRPMGEGHSIPFLQIADSLPNGSGFCRHLLSSSTLPVAGLIDSIVNESEEWPRRVVADVDHSSGCGTSCYKCLQRYNNRNYHGLLDWRLGLAYLRSMIDPSYSAGLSGDFDEHFELRDWVELANHFAEASSTYIPNNKVGTIGERLRLPAFSLDEQGRKWAVVVHPLWNRSTLVEILGAEHVMIDTFELARRPLQAIDRARRSAL
jgi:hypothetical protein